MDVLIKWEDGTENVVSTKDLSLTDGTKLFKKNKKVKMNYSGKGYYGVILATEYDDDEDNHAEDPNTPDSDVMSNSSDDIPLIELQDRYSDDIPLIEIKKSNEATPNHIMIEKNYTQSKTDSDDSLDTTVDDSDKDPDFIINYCEAKKCKNLAVNRCDSLLCKKMVCEKHYLCRQHCKLSLDNKRKRSPKKAKLHTLSKIQQSTSPSEMCAKKRKKNPRNKKTNISAENEISNEMPEDTTRNCEYPECLSEIFSTCNCLKILLCYEDFIAENNCQYHANANPHVLFPVEGSPREIPIRRIKKINTYKLAKERKNKGECYVRPKSMNIVPPKYLGPRCKEGICSKRGKKCSLFSDEHRSNIMQDFYSTGSLQLQREYLVRYIKTEDTKQKTTNKETSKRTRSNYYFLPFDGEELPVYKTFFINTLATSDKTIRTTLAKISSTGIVEKEKRGGRYDTQREKDIILINGITDHINKFGRVESHYCRKNSTREYLHEDLNLLKMFSMYQTDSTVSQIKAGYTLYRKVFKSMNLSFHRPKKDQCSLCMAYKGGDEETKQKLYMEYNGHTKRKEKVRKMKDESKKKSQEKHSKYGCAVFDLQQVFSLPITKESAVFYKRRLSVYNFTVYDVASSDCDCYLWHEAISKRGSSEIATCVYNSIRKFESQNKTIIQAVKGAGDIFIPSQLVSIIRLARRKHPYNVTEMDVGDFLAFKELSKKLRVLSIRECDDSDDTVDWTQISEFLVTKSKPESIMFKVDINSNSYNSMISQLGYVTF